MKKAIIIHGIFGHKDEHWFAWLDEQLQLEGWEVWRETLPNPDQPNLDEWLDLVRPEITSDTVIIGHSLGVPVGLKLVEESKIRSFFSIAGFAGTPDNRFTALIRPFTEDGFDWRAITNHCDDFHIWASDDDPYVDLKYPREMKRKILGLAPRSRVNFEIFSKRNHLGTWPDSKSQFPELLQACKSLDF